MQQLSFAHAITFLAAVGFQFLGIAAMPATKGMTAFGPTIVVILSFIVGITLLARLMNAGAELGLLVPLQAAILPLLTIAVGVMFYKEPASLLRIMMLLGACALIAGSNFVTAPN